MRFFNLIVLVVPVLVIACSNGEGPVQPNDTVTLEGQVSHIRNDVPVDGGVVIDVDVLRDGADRLIFPSLFTDPPPTEDILRLYDVVRRVEVGDQVRAQGRRDDQGVLLETLWILDGQP